MNIKELRIGNLVYYGVEGRKVVARVNCLYSETSGMIHMSTDNKPHIQDMVGGPNISPIPLTPEVLEGCGFENIRVGVAQKIEGSYLRINDTWEFTVYYDEEEKMSRLFIEYNHELPGEEKQDIYILNPPFHRLQNIIHALTGEELDVEGVKNLGT